MGSNSLRVLKTTRQTALEPIGYVPAAKMIIEKEGWMGLFGRGLKTRILTNGLQGALFTVGWRAISEWMDKKCEPNCPGDETALVYRHKPLVNVQNTVQAR